MYKTIGEIKRKNKEKGGHWFSKNTLEFFRSEVYPKVYDGCFFITSEKFEDHPRLYTIRQAKSNGDIRTVGEFQAYVSLEHAKDGIRKCIIRELLFSPTS